MPVPLRFPALKSNAKAALLYERIQCDELISNNGDTCRPRLKLLIDPASRLIVSGYLCTEPGTQSLDYSPFIDPKHSTGGH